MQISPTEGDRHAVVRPGDLVRVRRARWRIVQIRTGDGCQVVTLRGLTPPHLGVERRVLTPFDVLEPICSPARPRIVRRARWRRACRALIAADGPPGSLRTARAARIELLPHQLEPAMAILRGLGTRLLLADDVGLGKTIQAGLIVSELLARGSIDRVLVLTPPGLRDQWRHELAERFAIEAPIADGHALKRLGATLPIGFNPWQAVPSAIASIDYVKRLEIFPAVASCRWDLVIVDEAHACAGDSDRRAVAHALAARAAYVVLLSATPHSGDRETFAALCALGRLDVGSDRIPSADADEDAPLLVFRRTREDAGIGTRRRVHIVRVTPTAAEMRMHAVLARYSDAVRAERREQGGHDAWLALAVLHKRVLSSAWSLGQSIGRRLVALTGSSSRIAASEQLALPLGDPEGELVSADEMPAWPADLRLSDPAQERRLLIAVSECAHAADHHEAKLIALRTLLRRANQSAVVFTEYRDTLLHIRDRIARPTLVLHGGLGREERRAVLDAFARDPCAILLATDAAAEGLNLHRSCRLVINLELPWNPMRLEQRIGRVDRIGQRRPVHAFHLVADRTGEMRILSRLRTRVALARADIGAPDPLGDDENARLVIAGEMDA
jgi:SNF2 family DNA or RNA helicase